MPNKINQQELQEFWEWCGIHFISEVNVLVYASWVDSEGNQTNHPDSIPLDLNNLFKYAVPKYIRNCRTWELDLYTWVAEAATHPDKDPAIALYQAIQKARREDNV